jgi:hypothetical protein
MTDVWGNLAVKAGLAGIYFAAIAEPSRVPEKCGLDAVIADPSDAFMSLFQHSPSAGLQVFKKLTGKDYRYKVRRILSWPVIYPYRELAKHAFPAYETELDKYPCILPNWDNTPRCGQSGIVLSGSTPALFGSLLRKALEQVSDREADKQVVFVKSWNEWAEGNYLEPDQKFGKGYLQAIRAEVFSHSRS